MFALLCAAASPAGQVFETQHIFSPLTEELRISLETVGEDEWLEVIVVLDEPDKTDPLQLPVPERIEYYRDLAEAMQKALLQDLAEEGVDDYTVLEQNWLLNSVLLQAKPRKVRKIAKRKDVRKVARNGEVRLVDPELEPVSYASEPGVAWGAHEIDVESCWLDGVDGTGVLVAHMDTGVDPTHPAITGKFSGYWFDAVDGLTAPYDDNGHGTHTLGTLLGGDGFGPYPDDLGVAPGASWAGVKVMDAAGVGTYQQCLAGLEFVAALKAKADVRVVCASWSLDDAKEDLFFSVCERLRKLGVLPVFAAGNDGPEYGSSDTPGNYPTVVGVGAIDAAGVVPPFSSRGDAPAELPWIDPSHWLYGGWNLHKPDLVAPGVDIRSCVPGGGFRRLSGTSMATPHVAGVAALMIQRNPGLAPEELLQIMIDTAEPTAGCVAGVYDMSAGWGCIDARRAVAMSAPDSPMLTAKTDPASANALRIGAAPRDGGSLLRFALPRTAAARLVIYDLAGREIRTLVAGEVLSAGAGEVMWDGRDDRGRQAVSGVYFARLSLDDRSAACKLVKVH